VLLIGLIESIRENKMAGVIKFSEDIVPLGNLKINPGKIVTQVEKSKRPVLLTNRGRGVAVLQSLKDFEDSAEEIAFMRGVIKGLTDLQEGREMSLSEVKKRLNL
jgi:prevent-host-death family protein